MGPFMTAYADLPTVWRRGATAGALMTFKELEILRLVADGLSNKEIAVEINRDELTVKSHLARIAKRHGLQGREQMVRFGIERGWIKPTQNSNFWKLTLRELQVVELAATGMPNDEIGLRLHLSGHTVSTHISRIFNKLGLGSRVQLVPLIVNPLV